jgi:hypothetical protein
MNQFTRNCKLCGIEYTTTYATKLFCTRYHKERYAVKRATNTLDKVKVVHKLTCVYCSTAFESGNKQSRYCSHTCKARRKATGQTGEWKANKHPLTKARLVMRDKAICQICMTVIDLTLTYPHMDSLTIDHIKPRSLGGSHNLDNLQIAHWRCNIAKADSYLSK